MPPARLRARLDVGTGTTKDAFNWEPHALRGLQIKGNQGCILANTLTIVLGSPTTRKQFTWTYNGLTLLWLVDTKLQTTRTVCRRTVQVMAGDGRGSVHLKPI